MVQAITLPPAEAAAAGTNFNVLLINMLVLYIATAVHPSAIPLNGPAMEIYLHLVGLSAEESILANLKTTGEGSEVINGLLWPILTNFSNLIWSRSS
jgi:hypothetical protein